MKQVTQNFRLLGEQVLDIEKKAIEGLYQYLDDNFDAACQTLFNCKGRVIVTGMGKSGHIGGKIAATLASTGTPAFCTSGRSQPRRFRHGCGSGCGHCDI